MRMTSSSSTKNKHQAQDHQDQRPVQAAHPGLLRGDPSKITRQTMLHLPEARSLFGPENQRSPEGHQEEVQSQDRALLNPIAPQDLRQEDLRTRFLPGTGRACTHQAVRTLQSLERQHHKNLPRNKRERDAEQKLHQKAFAFHPMLSTYTGFNL